MNRKLQAIRCILCVAVLLWSAFIFSLSAQNADSSQKQSGVVTDKVIDIYSDIKDIEREKISPDIIDTISDFVRSSAHFSEFCILGMLAVLTSMTFFAERIKRGLVAGAYSLLYILSDEIHQIFVPGRACELKDILIDLCGALIGIAFILLIEFIATYLRKRKTSAV